LKRILGFFTLVFFAVSSAGAIHLQIKIAGGLGYYNLKDINRVLNSWEEYLTGLASTKPGWSFQSGVVPRFQSGVELEGDLLFSLTRRLAISLGSGYIYGELSPEKTEISILRGLYTYVYTHPVKVSAQPLTIAGYYFLPLAKKLSLFFRGGGGYVWAKYIDREGYMRLPSTKFTYQSSQMAKGRGTVIEAGLGLKYEFDPAVSLFFEALGRQAKAKDFKGEISTGINGNLYFFEEYNPDLEIWQAKMQLLSSAPAGEYIRSAREAVVDFNGFSLKIGIMLRF
jgi:hypothetical protein